MGGVVLRRLKNQRFACNLGFGVVISQIAGDGVNVDVVGQMFGNVTKQPLIDHLLCQFLHAADMVQIHVKFFWVNVLGIKSASDFTDKAPLAYDRQNGFRTPQVYLMFGFF